MHIRPLVYRVSVRSYPSVMTFLFYFLCVCVHFCYISVIFSKTFLLYRLLYRQLYRVLCVVCVERDEGREVDRLNGGDSTVG